MVGKWCFDKGHGPGCRPLGFSEVSGPLHWDEGKFSGHGT